MSIFPLSFGGFGVYGGIMGFSVKRDELPINYWKFSKLLVESNCGSFGNTDGGEE